MNASERFEALRKQIGNIGYVTLWSFGYSRAEAEQEAMIAAWKIARTGVKVDHPQAAVRKAILNAEYDKIRKKMVDNKKNEKYAAEAEFECDINYGSDVETEQQFRARLTRLKPDRADLVVDAHYYGYEMQELADKHGVPRGTVKSRLNRSAERLRILGGWQGR